MQPLLQAYSRSLVVEVLNESLQDLRFEIRRRSITEGELEERISQLADELRFKVEGRLSFSLRRIINATGVILYTNAGRSPLSSRSARGVGDVITSYTNLEYDLESGRRGHRDAHFEARVCRLLGCEAATVCNNAAAAVLLILNTLALGKKVLVSRGELIEIGGSFRIPAIMEKSGATLAEVGTTNKTKPSDYADAIDEQTALILRVHPSNYRIVGFTQRPELVELVEIARKARIPLVHDVGSGYLYPTEHPFLKDEPTVQGSLRSGCDLICFSGDKLLGGPQAGLILGRKDLVGKVRKNPLMRALRVDKMVYAALDSTLITYEKGTYQVDLPVWQMLSAKREQLYQRALRLKEKLSGDQLELVLKEGYSLTGGGSAPEERIPTWLLAVTSKKHSPNQLERALRSFTVPILSRIEEDQVLLDLRTVFPDQDDTIASALDSLEKNCPP
jgi:L-seryl-tRNA(Ser) seleniumtransferase